MSTPWNLAQELCSLAKTGRIEEALSVLGLVPTPESHFDLVLVSGWVRGGAETYHCVFEIAVGDKSRRYVLKACAPFSPAIPIRKILDQWLERRMRLVQASVSVPTLFAVGDGIILEEFVPWDAMEQLKASSEERQSIIEGMAWIGGRIALLNYRPVELFTSLRSRGTDAVVVDFGEDLGPYENSEGLQEQAVWGNLLRRLAENGIGEADFDAGAARAALRAGSSEGRHPL